jgi:hypothetical protein
MIMKYDLIIKLVMMSYLLNNGSKSQVVHRYVRMSYSF